MAVDKEQGAGQEPGNHAGGLFWVELRVVLRARLGIGLRVGFGVEFGAKFDEHEALPGGAVARGFGSQFAQKGLFELEDIFYVHAGNQGLGGGNGGVGEDYIFEFIAARGQDGGSFIDLGGIEQIEHGKVLHGQNFVHAFQAESALLVEKIGDMGLLESGLLGQVETGEFACFDALPEDFPKIILQDSELHGREYSTGE